jgi:hypothetical protein
MVEDSLGEFEMSQQQRLGLSWFFGGVLLSALVVGILTLRDFGALASTSDHAAALVLGVLATVQFGIIMPITCILIRYRGSWYNFFHALLFLLGFTVATGAIVAWSGSWFFALLYVCISSGILAAFYLLTCELHKRMHRPEYKNRP